MTLRVSVIAVLRGFTTNIYAAKQKRWTLSFLLAYCVLVPNEVEETI